MHLSKTVTKIFTNLRSGFSKSISSTAYINSSKQQNNEVTANDIFNALNEKVHEENNETVKINKESVEDSFLLENIVVTPDTKLEQAIPKPFLDPAVVDSTLRKRPDVLKIARNELFQNPPDSYHSNWYEKWPVPKPFNPYLVPLPIRMGKAQKKCISPDKYGNLELIKVQNFLHLTPPAIKKDCDALKKFCTPFPAELKSDEACERMFPVESHSADYITASNSVMDRRARTVTKTVRLCSLVLNDHARRKMIQLLGKGRYNSETDVATIKVERCPTRKQNSDFINYVLTALYFESWAKERWEVREEMNDDDCYYWWENSNSHKSLKNVFREKSEEEILNNPEVESYRKAVTAIKLDPNQEPDVSRKSPESRTKLLDDYKQSVLKLLNLQPLT